MNGVFNLTSSSRDGLHVYSQKTNIGNRDLGSNRSFLVVGYAALFLCGIIGTRNTYFYERFRYLHLESRVGYSKKREEIAVNVTARHILGQEINIVTFLQG